MRLKHKIFIILYVFLFLMFGISMTYSVFRSNSTLASGNQNIAKFVFNNEGLDELEIPLINLVPNAPQEYLFQISNNGDSNVSNVSIDYQLSIKTYHFIPLKIELYLIENGKDVLVLDCNEETYTRNENNELLCNTATRTLEHSTEVVDNYKLIVKFEDGYSNASYSNLVDYINIEINSWQKIS